MEKPHIEHTFKYTN